MIVMFGATGNIGKLAVPKLAATGEKVRIVGRNAESLNALASADNVETAVADYSDRESVKKAVAGGDTVVLITTPHPGMGDTEKAIVDEAKAAGAKKIVKVSAIGAAEDGPVMLGREHAKSEANLKASGLQWTIIQPHAFMQNMYLNLPTINADGSIYNAQGEGAFSTVDADDVAEVVVKAATEDLSGQQLMLTGPEAITWSQMAQQLGEAAGRDIKHVSIPEEAYSGALQQAGLPDWLADDLAKMSAMFGTGAAAAVSGDIEKILGRKPKSFKEWAAQNAPAFKPQS